MYLGVGNTTDAGANRAALLRTDDAAGAAVVHRHDDRCRTSAIAPAQCWYDNVVYSPPGAPDVVYLGGSYYVRPRSTSQTNGRAVLLSTDGGATFTT